MIVDHSSGDLLQLPTQLCTGMVSSAYAAGLAGVPGIETELPQDRAHNRLPWQRAHGELLEDRPRGRLRRNH